MTDERWVRALRRFSDLARDLALPVQAVGGLAARAWGGARPLVDLDFYVPDGRLADVAAAVPELVVRGPERIESAHWDVAVLALSIDGCLVELGGAGSARMRPRPGTPWVAAEVAFERGVRRSVAGIDIPVMPLEALVAYKRLLAREVDLVDLHDLTDGGGAVAERLAVYGTLMPGEVNHHLVAHLRGTWARGTVRGERHADGWGMAHGFPALVWHPDGPEVPVHLLTSSDLHAAWERLDAFEGDAYRRIVVPVTVDRERILANIYVAQAVG